MNIVYEREVKENTANYSSSNQIF